MSEKKTAKLSVGKIIAIVLLAFFLIVVIGGSIAKKRNEKKLQELNANYEDLQNTQQEVTQSITEEYNPYQDTDGLTEDELKQQQLVKVYGVPPQGFKWNDDGEAIPLSDSELTAEEVCWRFLQALSNKDFITAQKYSENSKCVSTYENMFSEDMGEITLSAWVYSYTLDSIEIEEVRQEGVFKDSTYLFSVTLSINDLANKTFWEEDKYSIFQDIYEINTDEHDIYKVRNYVNNLIIDYYKHNDCVKTKMDVLLSVSKRANGGYLVSEDSDLVSKFTYTEGITVYEYIMDKYSNWASSGMPKEDFKPAVTQVTEDNSDVVSELYYNLEEILNGN